MNVYEGGNEENVVRIHLPAAVAGRSYGDDGTKIFLTLYSLRLTKTVGL